MNLIKIYSELLYYIDCLSERVILLTKTTILLFYFYLVTLDGKVRVFFGDYLFIFRLLKI